MPSYRSIHVYILFQLLIFSFVSGQPVAVKHPDFQNRLSNNSVISLYQDSKGFVWVGTYNGLNRYDGYDVKVYKNEIGNTYSLPNNSIYSICEDSQGDIWLASRKGVGVLDAKTSRFTKLGSISVRSSTIALTGNIHQIIRLHDNKMAIASENYGLVLFDNKEGATIPIQTSDGLDYTYDAKSISEDTLNGKVWFWVENKGLFCLDRNKHIASLKCDIIKNATTITWQENEIWIGTIEGLVHYNITDNTLSANILPSRPSVVSLMLINEKLWIGTDGQGLFYLLVNDPLRQIAAFRETDKLKSNSVYSLMKDWNGDLWVGTLRGGCSILYNENSYYSLLRLPSVRQSLADNFIFSFCEDNKGNVWVGTDGAGLKCWNRGNNTFISYSKESHQIGDNFITGIVQDGNEHIWISTWYNGVNRFNIRTNKYQQYKLYNKAKGRNEKNTWFVYRDSKGILWASTTNNGTLYQYDSHSDSFYVFDDKIENIQVMQEDKEGNLWAGDYNNLILLDRTARHHIFYKINYPVRSILDDGNGFLWVGTEGGGLLVIKKKTMQYKRYSNMNGLLDNSVLRLQNDGNGNIWLSTFSGLASINIRDRKIKRLPVDNSEKLNQFSYNAAVKLKDGALLFGGISGICIIHPKYQLREDEDNHRISLTGISINNATDISQYIDSGKNDGLLHLKIPYTNNTLSVSFSNPEFLSPDQIQYSYKLDNWDSDWSPPSNNRNVNYAKLSPGTYHFEVKSANAFNEWSPPSTLVTFTILPPWYATWWAYLLYAGVCIAGIVMYVQYVKYKQQMQYEIQIAHLQAQQESERNERKLSFFTHISHELRTPLTLIINPLKSTLKKFSQYNNTGMDDLNIAYKNARRMLALVDQLMLFRKADESAESLKLSRFRMEELIDEVCACFESLAKEKNIAFTYACRYPSSDYVEADKEKLEIILFNLLSNSFKYTGHNGNIKVDVQITHTQECIMEITDDGKGIPPEAGNRIFEKFRQTDHSKSGFGIGLYLVKYFVELHGGNIHYHSVPDRQTLFSASLPIAVEKTTDIVSTKTPGIPLENINCTNLPLDEMIAAPFSEEKNQMLTCDDLLTTQKKILVVEDERQMREYLFQLFKDDYIVCTAADGEAACRILEKELPDLVISDVQMEPMDGLTLCSTIKNSEKIAHIPIILLTSSVSEEVQIKGMNAGADNYVTKPFDSDVLKIKVKGILENRSKLQQYFFNKVTLKDDQIDNSRIPYEYREFVQQCIRIVENNLDNDYFDIKKFCKEIGMSHSALYKKVKNVSGQTINRFIRSIRLRQAAVLMLKESYSVNQAAFQVGIGDIKYFREQFKALFGMNPSEYVKRYRSNFHEVYHKVTKSEDK